MKVLFIADIVGKPGRRAVRELLPRLREERAISLVLANGENAAGGFGLTRDTIEELFQSGIDVLTSGNHIWDKRELVNVISEYATVLRPANFPAGVPGEGSAVVMTKEGSAVAVVNLLGRTFMDPVDCPFQTAQRLVPLLKEKTNVVLVDFHAEATSEKKALAYFLEDRVSAVIGTHTHVQTADETVLAGGAAYITDAGMTGPHDSVIGIKKDLVIERFLRHLPNRLEVARENIRLEGVLIEIDADTGKSVGITRLSLPLEDH